MDKFLTDEEVNEFLIKAKSGDNDAWTRIYNNFENYVHCRAWKRLKKFDIPDAVKQDYEIDLVQAGWQGVIDAVRNFDPDKGKFLAYATHYIDGGVSRELGFLFNPLGLTERPLYKGRTDGGTSVSRLSIEGENVGINFGTENEYTHSVWELLDRKSPDRGKYPAERRVLQIIDILKILTDDEHKLSKEELSSLLMRYREAKYDNGTPLESRNTLTSTIENMILELNPEEYSEELEGNYRIKYEGYKENRLREKQTGEKGKKSPEITGFSYVHTFNFSELDWLIRIVCASDMIDAEEKEKLVGKLVSTQSVNYKTSFWNGEKLMFNPAGVHGRFTSRNPRDKAFFAKNLKQIQYAVNNLVQIRFCFNRYTAEHELVPVSDYIHVLSPYHLVVYHDNYYCIGMQDDDKRIWHYRVDLMTDVEILMDDVGKPIPARMTNFEGNPICSGAWNPEKYMSEHLNMAYDEPRDIRIKIKNTDYTIIHDWFGDHYEKTKEVCEDGYDIVKVRTSPNMIVHWAMQYGARVEIMEEDIREKIISESERIIKAYER